MKPVAILLALAALACGCRGGQTPAAYVVETGGRADRGRAVIGSSRCGTCHVIPGVRGARGTLAPPLTAFALRAWVGGELPNTPENVVRWIESPRSVEPGTAMPDLGLDEQQARDVAAYLYTLR
ncbi:MAG TPA: c-type cytochrome [Candidatus Polarisedimenticolaceae bacterium]|nr:c-type cytochrome [Candidatus Polarisedimenticolaceae bacterium]